MIKDKLAPNIQYECPACGDQFDTKAKELGHMKKHDDEKQLRIVVLDLYGGTCALDVRPWRTVDKDTPVDTKVTKGTSSSFWYIEVEDDAKSILNAKRRLKTAVLRWLRRQAKMVKELNVKESE